MSLIRRPNHEEADFPWWKLQPDHLAQGHCDAVPRGGGRDLLQPAGRRLARGPGPARGRRQGGERDPPLRHRRPNAGDREHPRGHRVHDGGAQRPARHRQHGRRHRAGRREGHRASAQGPEPRPLVPARPRLAARQRPRLRDPRAGGAGGVGRARGGLSQVVTGV